MTCTIDEKLLQTAQRSFDLNSCVTVKSIVKDGKPFYKHQYQRTNSPYWLPYFSCSVNSENLVLHQDNFSLWIIFFIVITCLLDIRPVLQEKINVDHCWSLIIIISPHVSSSWGWVPLIIGLPLETTSPLGKTLTGVFLLNINFSYSIRATGSYFYHAPNILMRLVWGS